MRRKNKVTAANNPIASVAECDFFCFETSGLNKIISSGKMARKVMDDSLLNKAVRKNNAAKIMELNFPLL